MRPPAQNENDVSIINCEHNRMVRGAYWNEEIETMAPAALRRLENERLRAQIAYNCATSPYYAAKLDAAGLRPEDVRAVEDLALVPFMEKSELAASQADGTLLGIN
jgi:phenylacetate-CoA ligase